MRCGTCGTPFEATRRDHRFCSALCRHRGWAAGRAQECRQALVALDGLRVRLVAEAVRWEAVAAGQRRRPGAAG